MIPEEQIRKRLSEIGHDIKFWADELKKELSKHTEWRDEGYIEHCRCIVAEFVSEKKTLIWVLGPSPQTQPV